MSSSQETEKQLESILTQVAKAQNIDNFETNADINHNYGDGFVANFFTGTVRNKNNGDITGVAIKKSPQWEFDYSPLFKNEIIFYDTIIPALYNLQNETGISKPFDNVPKYFCGSLEPKMEYVAMENLKRLGYALVDKTRSLDKEILDFIFKTYAKLHALSFVLRKKNYQKYLSITTELIDLREMLLEFEGESVQTGFSAAVNALDIEKDKAVYDTVKDFQENLLETYVKSCEYHGEYRCITHGDGWSNNILFKYSESGKLLDLKLIDFQLCRDGTPIHDLCYFFYSGASKEDFDNLDEYLQMYYESFSEFATELGGKPEEWFSLDVLKNEWKENSLMGVVYGIYLWQVKLLPKEDIEVFVDKNNETTLSMEESSELYKSVMAKTCETETFKEKATAILRHAFEYGIMKRDKIVKKNV